jgi:hypothetical protein
VSVLFCDVRVYGPKSNVTTPAPPPLMNWIGTEPAKHFWNLRKYFLYFQVQKVAMSADQKSDSCKRWTSSREEWEPLGREVYPGIVNLKIQSMDGS